MEKGWLVLKCFWLPEKNPRFQEILLWRHTDSCTHTSMMHKSALMLTPHYTSFPRQGWTGHQSLCPRAAHGPGGRQAWKQIQPIRSVSNQQEGEHRAWKAQKKGSFCSVCGLGDRRSGGSERWRENGISSLGQERGWGWWQISSSRGKTCSKAQSPRPARKSQGIMNCPSLSWTTGGKQSTRTWAGEDGGWIRKAGFWRALCPNICKWFLY